MLECTDPWLRHLEYQFLQTLHKRDIDDDHPVDDFLEVGAVFDCEPPNVWGVDVRHHASGQAGGAWAYDPPLKQSEEFDRLRLPVFTYNAEKTQAARTRREDLLGDILPVRVTAAPLLSATLGTAAADLRGLEQMMLDMAAQPELMPF